MTRTEQIIKTGTLIGTLVLALGLSGCFTAEEPTPFKCSDKKLGCPPGYKCDPIKGECVDEKTKLDGRVDGPLVDAGKDLSLDARDMAHADLPDSTVPDIPDSGVVVAPKWVKIKAGTFKMGSPDGTGTLSAEPCRATNETEHQVTLTNDFEIQNVEVTQGQFKALMGYNPSKFTACGTNCPVEQVSWHDAARYCNALSAKQGLIPCYKCTGTGAGSTCQEASSFSGKSVYECPGYRLPTEAEWEYAYRAGATTPLYNGSITNCSNYDPTVEKIAWYLTNAGKKTHPVGNKTANASGLYDVAGNVWEWCHDWYGAYSSSAATDPWGPSSGSSRVTRGGSYQNDPYNMRAARRFKEPPASPQNPLGFRPVRTLLPKPFAHWKFDEGSGSVANDSSGNKYHGIVSSGSWINGVQGKGLSFGGTSNGYVATTLVPQYGPKDSFSMAAWFKTTNSTKASTIFGLEKSKTSEIHLGLDTAGIVRFNLNDGSAGGDAKSKKSFADNVWHMIAAVRDRAGKTLYIYVDGVQVATATDNSTGSINSAAKLTLYLGAVNQGKTLPKKFFKGSIDEPQIFNTALTAGQVKLLYNSTISCSDKIKNGDETDVDCGGSRCNKCADTKKCTAATDCLSGICTGKVCVKGCKHQPVVKDCTKDASGVEWCKVPGGCFQMGSPTTEMCHQNDETPHQVTLTKNFSIQAKEVTQGQFKNLMGYNPSKYPSCGNSCPVEQVNWHEAAAYCNKLSTNAGYTLCYKCTGSGSSVTCQEASGYTGKGVYSCVGFRLPTEAEWEYAYRAGTSTAFYNGGISDCLKPNSNVDKIAWYCANSTVTYSGCYTSCTGGCCSSCMGPSPVGKKTPNAWGLWDMTGNVTEWGHDWHGGYGTTTVTNPWGVSPGTTRVSRGGSWAGKPYGLRAAVRSGRTPSTKSHGLGFRCLRTAIP